MDVFNLNSMSRSGAFVDALQLDRPLLEIKVVMLADTPIAGAAPRNVNLTRS
jgi:hypothetical protein